MTADHDAIIKTSKDVEYIKKNMITHSSVSLLVRDAFDTHRADLHSQPSWRAIGKVLFGLLAAAAGVGGIIFL